MGTARYSDKVKAEAVTAWLGGRETASQIARRVGCSDEAIYLWAKEPKFARKGPQGAARRDRSAMTNVRNAYRVANEPPPTPPEPVPLPTFEADSDIAKATALDIAGFAPSLETSILRMEARLAFLRSEVEALEKLLPRLKAALSALQEP